MMSKLVNNFIVKLFSLIFAFFLWYAVKNEEIVTKTLEVQIEPTVNDEMFVMRCAPKMTKVTIQGSRRAMKQLKVPPYYLQLNLTERKTAQTVQNYFKEIDFEFLNPLGSYLNVIKIEPEKVEIEIDRIIEKNIEIEAVTEGMPAPNYDLSGIKLVPSRLKIKGPEKILKITERLMTEKISITGMTANFIQEINIVPPFTGFHRDQTIKAYISISRSKQEKTFEKLPVRVLHNTGVRRKYTIEPEVVNLKISASIVDFQGISKGDFIAFVDAGEFQAGKYEFPVQIVKNDVFKIIEVSPKSVNVTISEN